MTSDPRIGAIIGGCRIEEEIGRGGMGVVYRAEQLGLGRAVAVKVIAPELARDQGFRERFEREWRVAGSIEHPNVIPVHHAGESDGELYITMRYVEGTDLRALIGRLGRLHPSRAADVVAQVAAALDAAHARGLVHRDVKPGNVLISAMDERDHVYLTDFGLTKKLSSASGLTRTGEWVGTVDYVAPEQIEGKVVDARADVYALGCVLHQTLTGEVPYVRDSDVAKMYAHLHEPPPSVTQARPDVPPEFDAVVERAMAKDPAERYQSAGDLGRAALAAAERRVADIRERSVAQGGAAPQVTVAPAPLPRTQLASPQPVPAAPESAPTALLGSRRRRRPVIALVAIAAVAAAAAALVAAGVLGGDEPTRRASSAGTAQTSDTSSVDETSEGAEGDEAGGKILEGDDETTSTEEEPPTTETAVSYTNDSYAAEYPSGWTIAEDDVLKTTYSRSKFVSPDRSQSVLIDHSPGQDAAPSESAAQVESQTAQSSGYERLSFEATTLGGRPAFEWTFRIGSQQKIDIFLAAGGDGFAVLAEGVDFEQAIEVARQVAASIQPSSG